MVDVMVVVNVVVVVNVIVVVVGCCIVILVVMVVGGETCDIGNYNQQTCAHGCITSCDVSKHMFICHVTHPICSNPGTSPVQKSSGLSPVLRNIPPQDSKNWLAHQPILSPGSPQESCRNVWGTIKTSTLVAVLGSDQERMCSTFFVSASLPQLLMW